MNGLFLDYVHMNCALWMDSDGRIAAWYELEDAAQAFDEYMEWYDDGLIDFAPPSVSLDAQGRRGHSENPKESPNAVTALEYYEILTEPTAVAFRFINTGLDDRYTELTLGDSAVWFPGVQHVAFALEDTDVSEFLRFYQHMLYDPAAYVKFRYGDEWTDYEWVDIDGIRNLDTYHPISAAAYRQGRNAYFRVARSWLTLPIHDRELFPSKPPPREAPPKYPLTPARRREIGLALESHAGYRAFVDAMNLYLYDYFHRFYTDPDNTPDIRTAMADIRAMPGSSIATEMVNAAMGRAN